MRAPAAAKRSGWWRNVTISASSSTASSQPTTSLKRVTGTSPTSALAVVKARAPPMPDRRANHTRNPMISATGRKVISSEGQIDGDAGASVSNGMPVDSSRPTSVPP